MQLVHPALPKRTRIMAYTLWVLLALGVMLLGYATLYRSILSFTHVAEGARESTSSFTEQARQALQ